MAANNTGGLQYVPQKLSMDSKDQNAQIHKICVKAARDVGKQLAQNMKAEMAKTVYKNGPGKPAWRESVLPNLIKEISVEDNAKYIEVAVGIPPAQPEGTTSLNNIVRAMVIEEGAGSAVGNPPIHAGPKNREVWDDDISDVKQYSSALVEFDLPAAFNQKGNHYVENAVSLTKTYFNDMIENIKKELRDSHLEVK